MDRELVNFALRSFVMILAIIDPLGNIPVFITTTDSLTPAKRRAVAMKASLVAAIVLCVFAIGGTAILWAFRLTMPAIQIAGGVILMVIALQMLSGRQFRWKRETPDIPEETSSSITPLAVPMMAGPAAMSCVLILTTHSPNALHLIIILSSIILSCGIAYICFRAASFLMNYLGRNVIIILSCIMSLILAALAVQFILDGLRQAILGLFPKAPTKG